MKKLFCLILLCASLSLGIDNSSLQGNQTLKHQRTYGIVFPIPKKDLSKILENSQGLISQTLLQNNLIKEALRYNIAHISVLHIHNPDSSTPYKILQALPKPPKPFDLALKNYGVFKASKNSISPWWLQIGVEKTLGYKNISKYNFEVVKKITPLRATPLPRVTGAIYKDLSPASQSQVRDLGSDGLNRIKDNKIETYFRPHMTLVYSDTPLNDKIYGSIEKLKALLNQDLNTPIIVHFDTLSIVELGELGNVLREIYRINLKNGKIYDVAKQKFIQIK